MKKLLLVANTSWSMIKFRYSLMKTLVQNGYDVYVIAPYDEYFQEIKNIGCNYYDIKMDNKGSNPIKDIKLIYDLYKLYKQIRPDLIFHYTIKPNIYGSIAAKLGGFKCISVIPGLGYTFINNNLTAKIAKILYKIALKIPLQVWFINEDDKNEFINRKLVNKDKVKVIPGEGVNTKKFKPIKIEKNDNIFKFLFIGRMLEDKGVYEYIEAGEILLKKYNNFEIGLLGYLGVDNPKAISKKRMNEFTKKSYIKYYGSSDDVRSFITQSDCIVLPSYREGISMTLMEAASMEKPLIATNVPGCKNLIDDGINGFLCKVKDSKDLAEKMEKILNLTEDERIKMGKAGREKIIREFDEKIVINKYLVTIEKILNS